MVTETQSEEKTSFAGLEVKKPTTEVLQNVGVNIILLGPAGSGKTTLAASCAEYDTGKPVLFVDAEGGIKVLEGMDNIEFISVERWAQLERFRQQCVREANQLPWSTIIFDNLSEFAQLSQVAVMGTGDGGQPSTPKWGEINRQVLLFVKTFRDLSRNWPINVVFVAWDAPDKQDEDGTWKRDLVLTPQLQKNIPGLVDLIGHVSVLNDAPKYTRKVSFAPSPKGIGKFRRALKSAAQGIPNDIFYGVEDMPMAAILRTLREGKTWDKTKYLPPQPRAQQQAQAQREGN